MVKTNLPVILLRGAVLLPYCEFRLELNNPIDKTTLEIAEKYHDNNVLIVSPQNPIEENIDLKTLPKIGTVAKINMKMELGNTGGGGGSTPSGDSYGGAGGSGIVVIRNAR